MNTAHSTASRMRWLAAALLAGHAGLLGWSAPRHAPTFDEVAWLPAGISHWQSGNFALGRVNPPLVRLVAALPSVAAGAETDWSSFRERPGSRSEFQVGIDFMAANGWRSFRLYTWGRWACIPFSLLAGCVCYRWSSELYGAYAGLLSLTLWCFCPNVLAHGALLTPDVAASALGLGACWLFWRWLKEPRPASAVVAGLALGLAQLTRTTWIVLYAVFLVLFFVLWLARWCNREGAPRRHWRPLGELVGIFLLSLYVLNLGYGFEGTLKRLGSLQFVSRSLGGDVRGAWGNRFDNTWLGELPVPLPANYVLGVDHVNGEFELGKPSYLRGEWRHGGWWYYYLYALTVKVPLGTLLLAGLAVVMRLVDRGYRAGWRDEIALLAPAAAVLAFVSSQTGFNHHLRYVLPIFPFACVWIGSLAGLRRTQSGGAGPLRPSRRRRGLALVVAAGLSWSAASSLWIYPHSLSYFNELAGGPLNGHAHLVDSNIDWGQDLLYLKRWLDEHPGVEPLGLAYFGLTDPRLAGIDFTLPPAGSTAPTAGGPRGRTDRSGPPPGWYALSVNYLRGYEMPAFDGTGGRQHINSGDYRYFLRLRPVARAGSSIYIYHVRDDSIETRVRRDD